MSRRLIDTARRYLATERGLRFLDSLVNFEKRGVPDQTGGKKFSLKCIKQLLWNLGDPQRDLRIIHVAGSKGKGSVAAFLSSMFSASSLKVGRCMSPHVAQIGERIAVSTDGTDGSMKPISIADLDALLLKHRPLVEKMIQEGHAMSYFTTLIAMSFLHFAQTGAKHAVVETGLGGVTDGTNCLEDEQVDGTILCPIEKEHVGVLGENLDAIIESEVSITRPHRPVIIGPQYSRETHKRILDLCRAKECLVSDEVDKISVEHLSYHETETSMVEELDIRIDKSLVKRAGDLIFHRVRTHLIGPHQHQNIQTAILAALVAKQQGWPLTEQAIGRGIEDAFVPARFQIFRDSPASEWYIVDGAHTKYSARALAHLLRELFPDEGVAVVLCLARQKQYEEILREIIQIVPDVTVITTHPIATFFPPGTLLAHWEECEKWFNKQQPFRCRKMVASNMSTALLRAQSELKGVLKPNAKSPGVICVTGSLYAAGEALNFINSEQK